ncbi:hypothetical protein AALA98_14015 [Lachnospiraceae bacterium 45-W7]
MGHAKEITIIDVYGDNAETLKDTSMPFGNSKEIIADCLDDFQPISDDVVPKAVNKNGTDFSEDNYME